MILHNRQDLFVSDSYILGFQENRQDLLDQIGVRGSSHQIDEVPVDLELPALRVESDMEVLRVSLGLTWSMLTTFLISPLERTITSSAACSVILMDSFLQISITLDLALRTGICLNLNLVHLDWRAGMILLTWDNE